MNKKDLDEIWDLLKSKKTNIVEITNVWNLLVKLEVDGDFKYNEDEVIQYVTSKKYFDLKYDTKPDFDMIIEECVDCNIIKSDEGWGD